MPGSNVDCVALILCQDVITDVRTQNKSIIGMFNAIATTNPNGALPRVSILVSLTDGVGVVPLSLEWRRHGDDEPIMKMSGEVDFRKLDRSTVADMVFNLSALPLRGIGTYDLQLSADSVPLRSRKIKVVLKVKGPPNEQG